MINVVTVGGRLTQDAELRATTGGTSVMSLSVAVNERVKKDGEWEDRPSYFDAALFGTRAEKLAPRLVKGMKVVISGKLRQERWQKDGQHRSKVSILIDEIEFMSRDSEIKAEQVSKDEYYDEDIPF